MWCDSSAGITSVRLHTGRVGLGMVLGPLELALMQALWDDGGRLTNKELRLLLSRAGTELSVPTVGTTMHRLADKGLVLESREGSLFVYEARLTEAELELYVVEHVLSRLRDEWPDHFPAGELCHAD